MSYICIVTHNLEHILDYQSFNLLILILNLILGINPQSIRGTNTGVVVGFSHYPYTEGLLDEMQPDWTTHKANTALRTMSNLKTLLANRISFLFDFHGLSLTTDTACAASASAFTLAVNEMLLGQFV